jgi:uncharacterized protein (DUF58 family)
MFPTARALGAIVLFLVLVFYAATSGVPWLFLLAQWLLVLVVAAFAYSAWNRRGVSLNLVVRETRPAPGSPATELTDAVLRRSPSAAPVFEGDTMGLEVAFRARRGRRGPVWAAGNVGGKKFGAGTGLVTTAGWSRVRWTRAVRRGAIRAEHWHLGTSDPLGLFQGFRKVPEAEVALVLPKFASLATHSQSREVESSMAAPRAGSGNELFGVREFRPGDSLRRIHWRSSARHGELVVREYEPPGVQTLAILVDPEPPSTEIADQIARIAASEAWDCLREGGRVALSGALETKEIWEVLEWLARYPDNLPGNPVAPDVVVAADPELLEPNARRNWLVGDAHVDTDVVFERVGTKWPL